MQSRSTASNLMQGCALHPTSWSRAANSQRTIMKLLKTGVVVVLLLTTLSPATNSAQQSALMSHDPLDPIAPTRYEECTALATEWDQRIKVLDGQHNACMKQSGDRCWQIMIQNTQAGEACYVSDRHP